MVVTSWVYLVVLALGSWMVSSWSFCWAVLAGGAISITSFWVSYRDVMGFVGTLGQQREETAAKDTVKKKKKGFILKFWLRIFLIGVVLLVLLKSGINVFGLILGLTTVVFTVTFSACSVAWRYYFSRR